MNLRSVIYTAILEENDGQERPYYFRDDGRVVHKLKETRGHDFLSMSSCEVAALSVEELHREIIEMQHWH